MKKILILTLCLLVAFGISVSASTHIPVLLYHNFQYEYTADKAVITVTPERFDEHMAALVSNGYTAITFEDVYNASMSKFSLPEKPVIVSFDDGYETNYNYAFPVLEKYGIKATIFVVASTVGQTMGVNRHFTWAQAKTMQQSGLVSIQSHTYSHMDLTTLSSFQLERELRMSKYLIEKNLGTECDIVAFPYGNYNQHIFDAAKRAGYKVAARVGEIGINTAADVKTKPLTRITVYGTWTSDDLIMMISANAKQ